MLFGLEINQLVLFLILLGAIVLLFTEWIRIDLVAILIILALSLSGVLTAEEALSGFSSEPAIMLAAIFVISGALNQTGLSEQFGNWIKRLAGTSFHQSVGVIMPSVALLSGFIGHVALTAIMLPVTLKISRENDIPPSKLLMPMSFAASLGTTIAIIGAPAFLIANGLLTQAGQPGLGIFSIAPIGLALTVAGTVFVLLAGPFLLPARERGDDSFDHFRLEGYYTELVLLEKSSLIGKTIKEIEEKQDPGFKVTAWFRDDRPRSKPFGRKKTKEGDVLVVRTNPEKLATIQQEPGRRSGRFTSTKPKTWIMVRRMKPPNSSRLLSRQDPSLSGRPSDRSISARPMASSSSAFGGNRAGCGPSYPASGSKRETYWS